MAIGCLFTCAMLIGCGTDTEPNVAEVVKINEPEFADIGKYIWHAEIRVRFSQPPEFLEVVDQKFSVRIDPSYDLSWEQTGNVVILSFTFAKVKFWGTRSGPNDFFLLSEEVPAEKQLIDAILTHHINITLTWSTGRKHIQMTLKPARVIAEDPSLLPRPQAALELVSPAVGGKLPSNQSIALYFDNNPGEVTASSRSMLSFRV